jgi:biotin carboxyl carrier protein
VLLIAIAACGLGLLFHLRHRAPAPQAAPAVRTALVRAGTLERTLRLTGSTAARDSVTLRAPYMRGNRSHGGGSSDFRLTLRDLITQGEQVVKGDIVAVFDRQVMLERLDNVKADLVQAEASVKSLAATLMATRETRKQDERVAEAAVEAAALDLKSGPVRSQIQADLFRLNLEESRAHYRQLVAQRADQARSEQAQLRIAQLEVQDSQLDVRQAEANAERMVVRAPRSGVVVLRETVRSGQLGTIRAGDELRPGQPYLDIVALGPMIVEAAVNQVDVRRVHVGSRALVTPDAFPDIRVPARVYAVGGLSRSSGWRTRYVGEVPLYLRIERSDPRVIPSLTVSADIVLEEARLTTVIPREAIFAGAAQGRPFALVRAGSGWERRDLDLGLSNHTAAAVLSGVEEGEVVARELPADFEN